MVALNSEEFKNSFEEEFAVYTKYQRVTHNENEHSPFSFINFLCSSPLFNENEAEEGSLEDIPSYGSYHQQYILNGKIIAVVI